MQEVINTILYDLFGTCFLRFSWNGTDIISIDIGLLIQYLILLYIGWVIATLIYRILKGLIYSSDN